MKCVAEDGADGKRRRCDAGEFATQRGALCFSYKLAETQAGAARPRTRDRLWWLRPAWREQLASTATRQASGAAIYRV